MIVKTCDQEHLVLAKNEGNLPYSLLVSSALSEPHILHHYSKNIIEV